MTPSWTAPAMPNAHSHAFQIGLRGRGERPPGPEADGDDFWSWRQEMFRLVAELDPDTMHALARRAYAEMAAAGYGAVGEFHYVHHQPDGTPYADPNELAIAVAEAAVAEGSEIVLLPAAYHRNGWDGADRPPGPGQQRFCDPSVDAFLARVDLLRAWAASRPRVHVGVAAHSVRAVPASWLAPIAAYADAHGLVRHVHAHEQRRELVECEAEHGCSPIELLHRTGFLGERTSLIHAIHVSEADLRRVVDARAIVVGCPLTEGNLGDGYLPAARYADAGVRLAIGSDSQVRLDPFEEVRELETGARRAREQRVGVLPDVADLWGAVCRDGAASLGLPDPAGAGPSIAIDAAHPTLRGVPVEDRLRALATACSAAVIASPPSASD
jgi:formimidoylglutamate deiminase